MLTVYDLTQPFSDEMPRGSGGAPPHLRPRGARRDGAPNVSDYTLTTHMGTHLDAPLHFLAAGPSIDRLPLERFHRPAVVWGIDKQGGEPISRRDLEMATPPPAQGDAALISTGWDQKYYTTAYADHPYLSLDAARWCVGRKISIVGVDTPTPDLPEVRRGPEFAWPVHNLLLSHDVLIVENLANLRPLVGRRVYFLAFPILLQNADGAPVRALAIEGWPG
jgi:arylformamidase